MDAGNDQAIVLPFARAFDFCVMAHQDFFFSSVPVVETVAEAILVILACSARSFSGPSPVAERRETVLPYFIQIIPIYVALGKRPVYIGAGANGTVYQY